MLSSELNIKDLSLTHVCHLEPNVKRIRLLFNRVKQFERQINIHKRELGYEPGAAIQEINRLRDMWDVLVNYDLINTNIKINVVKKEINQWLKIKDHWFKSTRLDWIYKKPKLTVLEKLYLERMEEQARKAKQNEMVWRLTIALEVALHDEWFVIMNTLTVNSDCRDQVFVKGSKCFLDYIKKFDKISGVENHKYFAVIEYGTENSREHYHVVHMLKEVPSDWKKDPNYATLYATRREIDTLKEWWCFGYSSPIAVRTISSDSWGQIGFRWPEKKVGNIYIPQSSGGAARLANYISKYISKSFLQMELKKWKPRIRQQLGMEILNLTLEQLSTSQLNLMMEAGKMQILTIHQKLIPTMLILSSTTRRIVDLLKRDKETTRLLCLKPQSSLMSVLRDSMRTTQKSRSLKIISSPITSIKRTELYNIQKIIDLNTIKLTGFLEYPTGRPLAGSSSAIR